MINVLIACEESQRVCKAFFDRGFNAFSCDIIEPSGVLPWRHIKGDALKLLKTSVTFRTMDGQLHIVDKWDLIIAHPPCTYLTVTGNRWFNIEKYGDKARERFKNRDNAIEFFMEFINADCEHIAVENPIGCMSRVYQKPSQIIQPFEYGYPARKATCLWLKNLPKLQPTNIVQYETECGNYSKGLAAAYARDKNGKALRWNDPETAKQRSKTVPGIASAMAEQWGDYLKGRETK